MLGNQINDSGININGIEKGKGKRPKDKRDARCAQYQVTQSQVLKIDLN